VTLTAVPGVRVGHWSDPVGLTGVTVVLLPQPNVTTAEVRGAAPGTRETALLAPGMKVESVQAIALCGGSAFGLAAADGVMTQLEADGLGYPTPAGVVPIVPAAVIFDLGIGDPRARPGPAQGAAAYRAATSDPVEMGNVGAGTGATVAGWRGPDARRKGGLGSAATQLGEVTVGALVVVNAVGDAFTLEGEPLTGGGPVPLPVPPLRPGPVEHTTLVVVATDAALGRAALTRVCVRAHDAIGACLRPSHTRYAGDAVFAASCGPLPGDPDVVAEAAFAVVGRSIEAALRAARPAGGIPALEDRP
jgi:L-aminopeptidase/D-esterase-like protein